jgi:succinate dehydrogenase/fumarate reductase flavoprotein subunit
MTRQIGELPPHGRRAFDLHRLEWLDLRNMLLVARAVAQSALQREESRGAHQREDFPATSPEWRVNQRVQLRGDELSTTKPQRAASAVAQ